MAVPRRRALVLALALSAGAASGARPPPPRSFSEGLEARAEATATAVVALRSPAPARVFVAGGTFQMGSTQKEVQAAARMCELEWNPVLCALVEENFQVEVPSHMVTVSPFWLDRTEVTVEAYGRCASIGACTPAGFPPFDPRYDRPELPVTHVTWAEAKDYCAFAKGRLPTEAEWELAARGESRADGTTTARMFPWGNVYNPHVCNHGSAATGDPTDATDGYVGLAPAGALRDGATPLGLLDMAGNAAEWVEDTIDEVQRAPGGRGFAPYPAKPQTNPVVTKGSHHVARGGSWRTPSWTTRGAARAALLGEVRRADVGFRCAYDVR